MEDKKKIDLDVEQPLKPEAATTAESHRLEALNTELGYHENSIKRIDEIRGYLHRLDIKGSDAVALGECLAWLRGVKTNLKFQIGKVKDQIKIESGSKENAN